MSSNPHPFDTVSALAAGTPHAVVDLAEKRDARGVTLF